MLNASRCFNKFTVVLSVLVFMSQLSGQISSGRVHGQITDPTGALIAGATISITSQSGQTVTTSSNSIGSFRIDGLMPGKYTLSATAKGFGQFTQDFELSSEQDVALNASLKIARQQLEIVVQGKEGEQEGQGRSVGLNSGSNANATVISGKELDYLSDDPSELGVQLLELAGPSAGPSGGHIYVDGFASGYLPPKISIREIRINQNPFAAEQDRIGYGRVEVFTKPGSSQVHGQFFADDNNSVFNSGNPFSQEKLQYNSNIFTGDLWGPLKKNLTGYISYQRRNIHDATPINAVVLDSNFNEVPIHESIPHSDHVNVLATRFEYQINPNHLLIGRYSYTGVADENLGVLQHFLSSKAFNYDAYEHRVQISDNFQISPRAENDIRFEFKKSRNHATAVNSGPGLDVTGAFEGGASNIGNSSIGQDYYELQDNTLITRGRHVVKFGGRLRTTIYDSGSFELFNGEFAFDSIDAYRITQQGLAQGLTPAQIRAAGGGAEQFVIAVGDPNVNLTAVDVSAFIQDDWRMRSNLNVGYGLRYETQNVIHDHLDLAPRIGIAWGLDGGNKGAARTILRAGAGIFYDRLIPAQAASSIRLNGNHAHQIIVGEPDFFPNVPSISALSSGQTGLTTNTFTQTDPRFKAPSNLQMGVALERQLKKSATASLTYLHTRGNHQLMTRNINAPLPGTFDPANPESGIRPLGPGTNIYQLQAEGVFRQHQIITSLNWRTDSRFSLTFKHTLNFARGNVEPILGFPVNQYDPSADYGRTALDIRHRLSLGGVIDLPRSIRLSPLFLLKSGTPYDVLLADDINGDTIFNNRPAFATDLSRPSVVFTPVGAFDTQPIPGQRIVPRGFGTGPFLYTLNLRLGKTFTFGPKEGFSGNGGSSGAHSSTSAWNPRYTMGFNITAQNILNHVNLGQPEAVVGSPLFGQSTTLAGGAYSSGISNRRITLQTSFTF
jgi:carboxypeptidase family protein